MKVSVLKYGFKLTNLIVVKLHQNIKSSVMYKTSLIHLAITVTFAGISEPHLPINIYGISFIKGNPSYTVE